MTDQQIEHDRLDAEWHQAFDALRAAGLEHDADHPIAARYRAASDAANHANRLRDYSIAREDRLLERIDPVPDLDEAMTKMEEWVEGKRSHINTMLDLSEDRSVSLAMCAIADAMEVVKLSAYVAALRARYG